jgi:hypothetical protein
VTSPFIAYNTGHVHTQLILKMTSQHEQEDVMEYQPAQPETWDVEADVVVVGFGAAGVTAAVTAHELGAKVVILEKAPEGQEGGNTRVAGQGYLNTSSVDKAIAYLTALCGDYTVPDAMVKVWAEEMCQNNAWLASLGGDPQEHQHQPVGIEFPDLPGSDCVHKFHDGPVYGYSHTWKRFESLVKERPIPIFYETPGRALIQHDLTKDILGVQAQQGDHSLYVKARRGSCTDLRRLRKQPGHDSQLSPWRALLLYVGLALQRRRRHRHGDVRRSGSLAYEQLRRSLHGAQSP